MDSTSRNRNSTFSTRFPIGLLDRSKASSSPFRVPPSCSVARAAAKLALARRWQHNPWRHTAGWIQFEPRPVRVTLIWLIGYSKNHGESALENQKSDPGRTFFGSVLIVGVFNHEFWCFSVHILMCESSILYYCFSFTGFNVLSLVVLDFSAFYRSFSWFHLKDPRFFILNYGGFSWFLKVSGCQKTCSTSISPSPWPDLRFSFETRPLMRPGATSCAPRAPIIWHIPSRRIPSTWHTYGLC